MNSKLVWLVVLAIAVIILPLFVTLPVLASWEVDLHIKSGGLTLTRTFAFDENSTDGYDPGLDKPSPPSIADFDAYFKVPGDKFTRDTRPGGPWTLRVKDDLGVGFTISWDVSSIPVSVELSLDGVDMREQTSQAFPAGSRDIVINATIPIPVQLVTVEVEPTSLPADGASTADVTVTVADGDGNPVVGETIILSLTPDIGSIGEVVDNGDGTYSATYIAGTTAAVVSITAETSIEVSGSANITLTAGPAETVTVEITPDFLVADSVSTADITVTVQDLNGNDVVGETITFGLNPDIGSITEVVDNGDGTYSATYTSGTTIGVVTITATTSNDKSGSDDIELIAGPAETVTVVSSEDSLIANGISTADITVTVQDIDGNSVTGETVTLDLAPNIGEITSPAVDNGDGTYSATYTSGTTVGVVTITATTSNGKSGSDDIELIAGPAATVTVASSEDSLVADGVSTADITVTVQDLNGNDVVGETITFELMLLSLPLLLLEHLGVHS